MAGAIAVPAGGVGMVAYPILAWITPRSCCAHALDRDAVQDRCEDPSTTPAGTSTSSGTLGIDRIEYKIPPALLSEVLNGADPELLNLPPGTENQRSIVRSFRLTFDRPVTLTPDAVALVLDDPNPNIPGAIPVVNVLNSTSGTGLDTVWNVRTSAALTLILVPTPSSMANTH